MINFDITVDNACPFNGHCNIAITLEATIYIKGIRAIAIALSHTRIDNRVLNHHITTVVGHGVNGLIAAGDGHLIQR